MRHFITVLIFFFVTGILSAQNFNKSKTIEENKSHIPVTNTQRKVILNVEFMKQGNMGCSRTSFAMVMHYYDPSITLEMVELDALKATDGGSYNNFMALLAEQYGFKTHAFPGTIDGLIQLLKLGKPVIVAQYPSLSEKKSNHDRIVVGFDQDKEILFVNDPSVGENIPYSYEKFMSLWESNVGLDEKYYSVLVVPAETKFEKPRKISVDGMEEEWEGLESFSPDLADDTGKNDLHMNIKDVYCFKDNSFIYFKTNFIRSPQTDPAIIYFFNFFYYDKGVSRVNQINFRLKEEPFVQIDGKKFEPVVGVEWKLEKVFEAKIALENFKSLPAFVSIQAGIYDTKRKKFIDLSYPNALKIK